MKRFLRISKFVTALLLVCLFLAGSVPVFAEPSSTDTCSGGHDWKNVKVTKKPTCTEKGEKILICSRCRTRKTVEIPATGHKWNKGKVTLKPTCTTAGKAVYVCTVCGAKKTRTKPALGHDWGEWTDTKQEDGSSLSVRTCGLCGEQETQPQSKAPGAEMPADEPALTVELLSFNAPQSWVSGALCTGELKVTNSGDVIVFATSYRVCDESGEFQLNDKLENWPPFAILMPGESMTLSVRVPVRQTDADAKKVVRTFTVIGETMRENEIKHDEVVSNTVTGTAEDAVLPAALTVELLSFTGPGVISEGDEISGELKVKNSGEVWVNVTSYRICNEVGEFQFNDKLENWPEGMAIIGPDDSFTLKVRVIAGSSDAEAKKVVRSFSVSGMTMRENEITHDEVVSNTVYGQHPDGEPVPPVEPEDPVFPWEPEDDNPGKSRKAEALCSVSVDFTEENDAATCVTHCEAHTEAAQQASELRGQGQDVSAFWLGQIEDLYRALSEKADGDAALLEIAADREAFLAYADACAALYAAGAFGDAARLTELVYEEKCAALCRALHDGSPFRAEMPAVVKEGVLSFRSDTDSRKEYVIKKAQ